MSEPRIVMIPRVSIVPGPNPRTHFNTTRIEELRSSMRARGFDPVFPLLVRPVEDKFEIACGGRRIVAATEEAIELIPCVVRAMTDEQMLEIALVENLQRDNLTALEEALGYQRMLSFRDEGKPVHSVATIAARIGSSERHVQDRVSLCRLIGTKAGQALEDEEIQPSHARLLARIPSPALRDKLLGQVLKPSYGPGPMSVAELEKKIKLDYMIELRGARFDQAQVDLVPIMNDLVTGERMMGGSCKDCPFNTANDTSEKGSRVHLCMNPECYRAKVDAAHDQWRMSVTDKEKGRVALPAEENAELWNHTGKALSYSSKYVELDEAPDPDELKAKVTDPPAWKKLIRGRGVPVILGRDVDGKVHEIAERSLVVEAARENEREKPAAERIFRQKDKAEAHETDDQHEKRTLAEQAKRAKEYRIQQAQQAEVVQTARVTKLPEGFWLAVLEILFNQLDELGDLYDVARSHGMPDDGRIIAREHMMKLVKNASTPDQVSLVVECLLASCYPPELEKLLPKWAKIVGADLTKVKKRVEAEIAVETAAAAEKEAIANGLHWHGEQNAVDEFIWSEDQTLENAIFVRIDIPGGKYGADASLGRAKLGWYVGWSVSEKKGKREAGEPCKATGVHYDNRSLALCSGLTAIREALLSMGADQQVKDRIDAYIASVAATPTKPKGKSTKKKGSAK